MPNPRVVWKSDEAGWLRLINSDGISAFTMLKAAEINKQAAAVFEANSKHDSEAPVFYLQSFHLRRSRKDGIRGWEAYNDDPTAEWVEFGAHAGGKTPVLKYRCYGIAMDIMHLNATKDVIT